MLEGTRLPFFTEAELRALDEAALREHAMHLHRSLGPSKIETHVPLTYESMLEWVLHHQHLHLAPLRGRSLERAVEHEVDREIAAEYVMLEGTRVPFFTDA